MDNLHKFYDKAYNWILTYGSRIVIALIVFFILQWLLRFVKKWLQSSMHKKDVDTSLRPFFTSLISATLQVLIILIVMQIIGLQMTLFATIIGGISVAAGLALSGTLQNFTSGILILLLKPYRVGDNIITQGQEGTVTSIQIFYTIITTFDNKVVIVPNSKLSNEVIINLSREGKRRLDIELKFNYGIDFDQVKALVEESIKESNFDTRGERITISMLEADGFRVIINVWTEAHGFNDTKYHLQELIMDKLKRAGIKLPGM